MMKTGLNDRSPKQIAVTVARALEGNYKIEGSTSYLAGSGGNDINLKATVFQSLG